MAAVTAAAAMEMAAQETAPSSVVAKAAATEPEAEAQPAEVAAYGGDGPTAPVAPAAEAPTRMMAAAATVQVAAGATV